MTDYLIFYLYGPMASFGDMAVGEYRPTYAHPSKSSIMGLVAAALGIERKDESRILALSQSLNFAVLVLEQGHLLRDYHTTQVPPASSVKKQPVYTRKDELDRPDLNTILSTRDYRADAVYKIALWQKSDAFSLTSIQAALRKPRFTLYLGRKSCPLALPLQSVIVKAETVVQAIKKDKSKTQAMSLLSKILSGKKEANQKMFLYQDMENNIKADSWQKIWRKDELISRQSWQYQDREEYLSDMEASDVL